MKKKTSSAGKSPLIFHPAVVIFLILALLLANIGLNVLKYQKNSFIDFTEEGLYTLTPALKKEITPIKDEIKVTFCADPDVLLGNDQTRYPYIMLREIEKLMDNVTVVTCDVEKNPTAVSEYRQTSATEISWDQIIVSCGSRYRILKASAFWRNDGDTGLLYSYDGEYKIASTFLSLTAIESPVVYFTVGHGEKVYDPEDPESPESLEAYPFYRLLLDQGLTVKTIDLDTASAIPEDCVLLIMNGPTSDYVSKEGENGNLMLHDTSPAEKIDRYLDRFGSLMILKDPEVSLPVMEEYLEEWGVHYKTGETVIDRDNSLSDGATSSGKLLLAGYAESGSVGHSFTKDIASLSAPPRTVLPHSGYIVSDWQGQSKYISSKVTATLSPLFLASESAIAENRNGELTSREGGYMLATVSLRCYSVNTVNSYSYVVACATTDIVSKEYLDNHAYANYDVIYSVIRNISRTDASADIHLGSADPNSNNYGGKPLHDATISATDTYKYQDKIQVLDHYGLTPADQTVWVILILLPVAALPVLGLVLWVRRKNR